MNSSLPLHLCLHSIFGRGSGIVAMFRVLLGPSKLEMHSKSKCQNCFPLSFWGTFQREDCLILGTSLYCHRFRAWLLTCMSGPACGAQCSSQLPVLLTGDKSKILGFCSPVDSGLVLFSDLSYRAACLLWLDAEPIVTTVQLKCKYFSNQLAWLIITAKGREAWKLRLLLLFMPTSNLVN